MHTIKNVVIILIIIIIIVICILLIQPKQNNIEKFDIATKIWSGGSHTLNINVPIAGVPDIGIPLQFGSGGVSGLANSAINTAKTAVTQIETSINASIDAVTAEIKTIKTKLETYVEQMKSLFNDLGGAAAAAAEEQLKKTTCLFDKLKLHIDNTIELIKKFTNKSDILATTIIECIIDIFTNINTIIYTLFNVDLVKFQGGKYNVTTKINLVGNRTKNLFSKIGSLMTCMNIFTIIIGTNRGIFDIGKIFKFLITTLLIDTWKYIQYTIKYNLIDLLSTKPLLKDIISQEIYRNAINKIILRSLQMLRGTIDFSELLIKIGINITELINLLLDAIQYLKELAGVGIGGGGNTIVDKIKSEIENTIKNLSPLPSAATFNLLDTVTLRTTVNGFRSILITIGCIIDDTLCNDIKQGSITTGINSCRNVLGGWETTPPAGSTTTKKGAIKLKATLQNISETLIQCEDTKNLNNYYCKLEIVPNLKKDVNDIENNINIAQDALYLKLYTLSIDISKPSGWSFEENKTHIEELIDIKKL